MEVFHHRYYRLNKLLLKSIGQWPHQSTRVRFSILVLISVSSITLVVPEIIAFVKNLHDWDPRMESITSFIFYGFILTLLLSSTFNSQKMLMLLNHIHMDWKIWAQDIDVHILHEYADNGRKLTIVYTVMGYTTCVLYISQPVLPKIIDVLLKNGTEAGQFPVPMDYYYIDDQEYYFYIILHCFLISSMGYIISIACSSMFIVYVYHGCALFAMVGRKLERIGKNEISVETGNIANGLKKPITSFEYLVSCIEKHNHAIEYAELIEATYSWCFFFIVGCSMILISIVGVEITARTNDPEETLRYISIFGVIMIQLYVDSYMAQSLTDHSVNILNDIFNSKWYKLPLKAQRLLPLIMMRCNVCCKLTAAKMIIMSLESFGVILKTSLSYFTLLRSV